jgi:DNA-binding Lrp family transcriptional regulator
MDSPQVLVLKLIATQGKKGILQRDMWQKLGMTSRHGSRIALRLEEQGLIRRERELYNRRWTFRVFSNIQPLGIDSILDVPCLICENITKCDAGSDISSVNCNDLTKWLLFGIISS